MTFFWNRVNLGKHIISPFKHKYFFKANNSLCKIFITSWKKQSDKRTSLPVFSFGCKGSIAVETALVFPMFLFFVINILSIIQIFTCYSKMESILHQTAKKMSVYANLFEQKEKNNGLTEDIISAVYAAQEVKKEMGKEYLKQSPIVQGGEGLNFFYSQALDEKDCIDLIVTYKVRSPISMLGFGSFHLVNRCRMRAWTGYNVENIEQNIVIEEEVVYITETGEVYHTSSMCSHLNLSITRVQVSYLENLRNQKGEKYQFCELCNKQSLRDFCYITMQGDRYHSSIGCSGLKRQISAIPVGQAVGIPECSRCSG